MISLPGSDSESSSNEVPHCVFLGPFFASQSILAQSERMFKYASGSRKFPASSGQLLRLQAKCLSPGELESQSEIHFPCLWTVRRALPLQPGEADAADDVFLRQYEEDDDRE